MYPFNGDPRGVAIQKGKSKKYILLYMGNFKKTVKYFFILAVVLVIFVSIVSFFQYLKVSEELVLGPSLSANDFQILQNMFFYIHGEYYKQSFKLDKIIEIDETLVFKSLPNYVKTYIDQISSMVEDLLETNILSDNVYVPLQQLTNQTVSEFERTNDSYIYIFNYLNSLSMRLGTSPSPSPFPSPSLLSLPDTFSPDVFYPNSLTEYYMFQKNLSTNQPSTSQPSIYQSPADQPSIDQSPADQSPADQSFFTVAPLPIDSNLSLMF